LKIYSGNSPPFMEPEGSLLCSQCPPLATILSQMNQVHTFPSYFSKITISMKQSPSWESW